METLSIEHATSHSHGVRSSTALMLVSVVRKYADLQLDWTSCADTHTKIAVRPRGLRQILTRRIYGTVGCGSSKALIWEVSGASEVPQSHGKLLFRKSSCCAFVRKSILLVKIRVDRDRSRSIFEQKHSSWASKKINLLRD